MKLNTIDLAELEEMIQQSEVAAAKAVKRVMRKVKYDVLHGVQMTAAGLPGSPAGPPVPPPFGVLQGIYQYWLEALQEILSPLLLKAWNKGVDATMSGIHDIAPEWDAPSADPMMVTKLQNAENRVHNLATEMWQHVQAELMAGVEAGDSIQQMAQRVSVAAELSIPRATTVVRTEVISAANAGTYDLIDAAGFAGSQQWLATEDPKTRITHKKADGQKVKIGDTFTVGLWQTPYPGADVLPPSERANCRCTVAYDIDDEGFVSAMVAAGHKDFNALHPRDSKGKFVKKDLLSLLKHDATSSEINHALDNMTATEWHDLTPDQQKAISHEVALSGNDASVHALQIFKSIPPPSAPKTASGPGPVKKITHKEIHSPKKDGEVLAVSADGKTIIAWSAITKKYQVKTTDQMPTYLGKSKVYDFMQGKTWHEPATFKKTPEPDVEPELNDAPLLSPDAPKIASPRGASKKAAGKKVGKKLAAKKTSPSFTKLGKVKDSIAHDDYQPGDIVATNDSGSYIMYKAPGELSLYTTHGNLWEEGNSLSELKDFSGDVKWEYHEPHEAKNAFKGAPSFDDSVFNPVPGPGTKIADDPDGNWLIVNDDNEVNVVSEDGEIITTMPLEGINNLAPIWTLTPEGKKYSDTLPAIDDNDLVVAGDEPDWDQIGADVVAGKYSPGTVLAHNQDGLELAVADNGYDVVLQDDVGQFMDATAAEDIESITKNSFGWKSVIGEEPDEMSLSPAASMAHADWDATVLKVQNGTYKPGDVVAMNDKGDYIEVAPDGLGLKLHNADGAVIDQTAKSSYLEVLKDSTDKNDVWTINQPGNDGGDIEFTADPEPSAETFVFGAPKVINGSPVVETYLQDVGVDNDADFVKPVHALVTADGNIHLYIKDSEVGDDLQETGWVKKTLATFNFKKTADITPSVTATPAPSGANEPAMQHGSGLPYHVKYKAKNTLKSENLGYWSKPEKIWSAIQAIQTSYPDDKNPGQSKYTSLQILEALDSQLKTAKPNPYHEKIKKWLSTAAGKKAAGSALPSVPSAITPTKFPAKKLAKKASKPTFAPLPAYLDAVSSEPSKWNIENAIQNFLPADWNSLTLEQKTKLDFQVASTGTATQKANWAASKKVAEGLAKTPVPATTDVDVKTAIGAGDISAIPAPKQNAIFSEFKNLPGTYLTSGELEIFAALKQTATKHNLSVLQVTRIIDEQGALKVNVANGNLFEKKLIAWSKTKQGTARITGKPMPTPSTPELKHPLAVPTKANSDHFKYSVIGYSKAVELDKAARAKHGNFTAAEKASLKHFTGGSYVPINEYLRGEKETAGSHNESHIPNIQKGFRPSVEPMLLHRGVGWSAFGVHTIEQLKGLIGKKGTHKGFSSTSIGGHAAFSSKPVIMEVEAPPGTPMAFVDPFSLAKGENEMLLAAGLDFEILSVTQVGHQPHVRVRIIP